MKSHKSTIVIITHNKEILKISDLLLTIENGEQKIFNSVQNITKQMKAQHEKAQHEKNILEKQKQSFLPPKDKNDS